MAIEVRIPTILRTYTDGAKAVNGEGETLAALIDDLEANHPGIKDRLLEAKGDSLDLRRFVNVYINDEDVRFIGGLEASLSDGDQVVVLPAVAGGALVGRVGRAAVVGRVGRAAVVGRVGRAATVSRP